MDSFSTFFLFFFFTFFFFSPFLIEMKSIVAAIAALAVTMVSAQSTNIVTPHAPTLNQVLTAGETTTITWTPIAGFDTISTIDLLQGAASALTPVTGGHVASNVASSLGSYSWTVPSTLPAGSDCKLNRKKLNVSRGKKRG